MASAKIWSGTEWLVIGGPGPAGATGANLTAKPATTRSGTAYTLALPDAHSMVYFTNEALVTVTIPTVASGTDFTDGDRIVLFATGLAGLTVSTASITLLGTAPNKSIARNEALYLENITANVWAVIGGTAV
jgi:hypothetical protein